MTTPNERDVEMAREAIDFHRADGGSGSGVRFTASLLAQAREEGRQQAAEESGELLAFVKAWAGEMAGGLPEDWNDRNAGILSNPKEEFWRIYGSWLEKEKK